ncbi:Gfo/Idh/MocA family protein [Pontibacter liquoris]|uniref:Gfo/Idh/MocA family protein n=1 Tax=Pontibacter liquoris TaxID=2905677 RepID=UPI001FA7A999|nr:Gfo/Idh/MocA family oxidoreductase [Pontibacter liquoris]
MKNDDHLPGHSRRDFIKGFSLLLGSAALGAPYLAQGLDRLTRPGEHQFFSGDRAKKKLGIALVGLGSYSTHQLAPALAETENCYLAGIVTGTPAKAETWKKKYNIPDKNIYTYKTFDQIKDNPAIDIVYVVLPNAMHAEYTIRAAQAGKHVISEKPMATSVADAERMIAACKAHQVSLSVGYRLHYEPHNLRAMELGQKQVYGKVKTIKTENGFVMNNAGSWRLNKELAGGGPLMDMGIYCVQGACYTVGQTPVAVTAKFGEVTRPRVFDEVEQSIDWQLEFPNGALASCGSSYNENVSYLHAEAEKGWWHLEPAYGYGGITGKTSEGPMHLPQVNQQALQMDGIAQSILENKASRVPGEMGLRDVKILMAIYEAARTGKKVRIA